MDVPLWAWIVTIAVILGMVVYDVLGHRRPHAPTLREAAIWSAVYVGIALAFGVIILITAGPTSGGEYFAGYLTEKALSVDNLFVFVLILSSFGVPREYQQKALLVGIVVALALRTVFIAVGAAAIEDFSWVFWIFGAILVYTAVVQVRHARAKSSGHQESYQENAVLRLVRRVLPATDEYHGDALTARVGGRRVVTPMLVVMVAIGSADVVFAVDSIPAIFGLTQEPYLVFAANAFSLLGLRQLYFLIDGLLDRLVHLGYGLAAILAFIGAKLVIHAMHTNELPFLNGGRHITVIPEIPTWLSLVVIGSVLAITTLTSLRASARNGRPDPEIPPGTGVDADTGADADAHTGEQTQVTGVRT